MICLYRKQQNSLPSNPTGLWFKSILSSAMTSVLISLSLWGGYMYELRLSAQSHSRMQQRTQGQWPPAQGGSESGGRYMPSLLPSGRLHSPHDSLQLVWTLDGTHQWHSFYHVTMLVEFRYSNAVLQWNSLLSNLFNCITSFCILVCTHIQAFEQFYICFLSTYLIPVVMSTYPIPVV